MPDIKPTKRLYFDDAFLAQFEARIVACTDFHGHPAVILDATALYPEGGGQPADLGTLAGVAVRDVQEEDDIIYHIVDEPLPATVGDTVAGTIDWQRRFDFMQQHTGQHTISGAFYRLCNTPTISWHLSGDAVNIDLGRTGLTTDALKEAEHLANEILWQDVPVTAQIYTREELATLALRKGSDREGGIRVVSIGDFDRIGCGGTHVASAGQVGAIGLRRWEAKGQTTRVEFACGARALADYHLMTSVLTTAGTMLSAKPADVAQQVERLISQTEEMRREHAALRKRLASYEARDLLASAPTCFATHPIVCHRLDERDANELRLLAQQIVEGGGIALLGGVTNGKAQLMFACDKDVPLDLNQILKNVLPLIGGKGGGQKFQTQGAGPQSNGLDAALAQAQAAI